MRAIEQTSLALLSIAVFLLVLLGAGFALDRYTAHPPIYVVPPESKDFSYVKSMSQATNLEGLKKICTFWAEREDQSRAYQNAIYEQFKKLTHDLVTYVALFGAIFGGGLLYIYITARRLRRVQGNAL